jgi:hypothetical protein
VRRRGGESCPDVAAAQLVDVIIDPFTGAPATPTPQAHARKVFHECGVAAGGDDICVRRVDPLYPGLPGVALMASTWRCGVWREGCVVSGVSQVCGLAV